MQRAEYVLKTVIQERFPQILFFEDCRLGLKEAPRPLASAAPSWSLGLAGSPALGFSWSEDCGPRASGQVTSPPQRLSLLSWAAGQPYHPAHGAKDSPQDAGAAFGHRVPRVGLPRGLTDTSPGL